MKKYRLKYFLLLLLVTSLFSLVFLGLINLDHNSGNHVICPETSLPQNCSKLGSSLFDSDLIFGLFAQSFSDSLKTGLLYTLLFTFFVYFLKSYFAPSLRFMQLRLFSGIRFKKNAFLIKLISWL